jgi:hypothetical protein
MNIILENIQLFFFELMSSLISILPSITFEFLWDSFANFFVENVYESPTSADNEPELSFHVPINPEVCLHTESKPTQPSQQVMEKCHDDLENENRRLLKELETLRQKSEQTDRSILHLDEQSNKELADLILESYKKESKLQSENESLKSCIHSLEKENGKLIASLKNVQLTKKLNPVETEIVTEETFILPELPSFIPDLEHNLENGQKPIDEVDDVSDVSDPDTFEDPHECCGTHLAKPEPVESMPEAAAESSSLVSGAGDTPPTPERSRANRKMKKRNKKKRQYKNKLLADEFAEKIVTQIDNLEQAVVEKVGQKMWTTVKSVVSACIWNCLADGLPIAYWYEELGNDSRIDDDDEADGSQKTPDV